MTNPAFGVWIFAALGRICHDPVRMVNAVEVLNIAALTGFALFAFLRVRPEWQVPWMLGIGLQAVNPLAILLSRKIWTQCVLPPFCLVTMISFSFQTNLLGALSWGLLGTMLGQIHLSGFFFQLALVLWALLLDLKPGSARRTIPGWPGPLAPLSRRFRSILGSGPSSDRPHKTKCLRLRSLVP